MGYAPTSSRRPRHAAMKDARESDEHRDRARTGRGVAPSGRPGSPPRGPRHNPGGGRNRHRHQRGEVTHDRHASRERSRDRSRQHFTESTRQPVRPEDLIPRYRENRVHASESESRSSRQRSPSRGRGGPDSPSSTKRHRSRSHSPRSSHRKRSKKTHSPPRRDRDHDRSGSKKRRRPSPQYRHSQSPRRRQASQASPSWPEDLRRDLNQASSSRSPSRSEVGARRDLQEIRQPRSEDPRHPSRSRSPVSENQSASSPGRHVSTSRPIHLAPTPYSISDRHTGHIGQRSSHRSQAPRSPRSHQDRQRSREIAEPSPSHPDPDVGMTSRGSYRGPNPTYSHPPYPGNDHRGYSQSPPPPNSYHNSPSPAPYGPGRSGWGGQQYSSHQQYPPPHHHSNGNYGPSGPQVGPQGHYHPHGSRSPPYAAPSGPRGDYRGGHRGAGFRGAPFSNRGGHRGSNAKNPHWNSAHHGSAQRSHHNVHDEESRRQDAHGDPNEAIESTHDTGVLDVNTSRQPQDLLRAENLVAGGTRDNNADGDAPMRNQPAKTESQPSSSAKFSFAFKSSKPTPTAPKFEISQKFNAAPRKKDEVQQGGVIGREPPPTAPREPSSARARTEFGAPPDGPKITQRMRKVKKMMKRPKPRPTLTDDLIGSDSVFFRKPGNESVVGSGTYGKVFKGLNVYTKGLVALKRIRMEGERDGFPVTAVREIKLLQSLRHTNIVTLQEVMVEKNDCFMVFEYLSHDLTGLLNHPSFSLNAAQKKHLAKQLFEGLDYLHERGVLHRDIKAANILVSNEGILKLADFGLARFYAKRHQLDYTNRVITIWYRSPELLLGETKYTAAVDVWSAACVMVEIFTRLPIFAGDGTELSQLDKIYNIIGTPNRQDWPGLVDMAWFELLRPTSKRKNVFAEKYQDRITPAAFDLLSSMFFYDPAKRPTAAAALQHPYFTTEEPLSQQAVELSNIGGDWHEFESKALRKENERKDREARRAAKEGARDQDKKRLTESHDRERISKKIHLGSNSGFDNNGV